MYICIYVYMYICIHAHMHIICIYVSVSYTMLQLLPFHASVSSASGHSDQPLFTDFTAGLSVGVLLGQMVDLSRGLILLTWVWRKIYDPIEAPKLWSFTIYPFILCFPPAWWGSWDLIRVAFSFLPSLLACLLPSLLACLLPSFLPSFLLLRKPRIATASARSQWALPDLNRKVQSE